MSRLCSNCVHCEGYCPFLDNVKCALRTKDQERKYDEYAELCPDFEEGE